MRTKSRITPGDQAKLWFIKGSSVCKSCKKCPDMGICGGMQIGPTLFDCTSFCCGNPSKCDNICRKNPELFIPRTREVKGFDLATAGRSSTIEYLEFPLVVPTLYHGSSRIRPLEAPAVALPLFRLVDKRTGAAKYRTKAELVNEFGVLPTARIIATGTDKDRPLETWWGLSNRRAAIRALIECGVDLVSVPNFSLFIDVPRWDNFFNMKRIAIVWAEMQQEGMRAALHLNARADTDYDRLAQFIGERPEVGYVAFEFATGAGWPKRIDWHIERLCQLAQRVGRPLTLVVRGAASQLRTLASSFQGLIYLETDSFMKTQYRQRGVLQDSGNIAWGAYPTVKGSPIDDLLLENVLVVQKSMQINMGHRSEESTAPEILLPSLQEASALH